MKHKKNNFIFYITILFLILTNLIICDEEVKEETHQPEVDTAKALFTEKWQHMMNDFHPDFVYMIQVDYKSNEIFYQKINHVPYNIKGAFIIGDDEETDIKDIMEFRIESPSGKIIFNDTATRTLFNLDITEVGIYKFYFDNRFQNNPVRVTFTLNSGNNNIVETKDLDFSNQKANSLVDFVEKMKLERKMKKNVRQNRVISKNFFLFFLELQKFNKTFFTFSVLETIALFSVSIWQFYYLNKTLDSNTNFNI